MADSEKKTDTVCLICNPDGILLERGELDAKWGKMTFPVCSKHNCEEVNKQIEEIVTNKDGSSRKSRADLIFMEMLNNICLRTLLLGLRPYLQRSDHDRNDKSEYYLAV